MKKKLLLLVALSALFISCGNLDMLKRRSKNASPTSKVEVMETETKKVSKKPVVQYIRKTATDNEGRSYEYITNDPMETRIYTLTNGLKVYLSKNEDEPRIQTYIAVKAGSKNDPPETTGLAHYFEHMLFKGTDEIGTLDWDKEKELLDQISQKFEEHRAEDNPEKKKEIYAEIDSLSQEASKYAAPNEYDKLLTMIGASGTNAYTSFDETVYVNNIPSNELERWMEIEKERFTDPVLRLFHTELETVYEEFNMYQDRDNSKVYNAALENIFEKHPYRVDVIGTPENLKNPSMVNIMNFWKKYYVPNNMAICLSGDLDYEKTMSLIEKEWKDVPRGEENKWISPVEKPLDKIKEVEIYGPTQEIVFLAFRTVGLNNKEANITSVFDQLLDNSKSGLININLNQKQQVLHSGSWLNMFDDYGLWMMYGIPKEGQTVEEVKELLLAQLDKIKNGEFDDWMIEAISNDMKLQYTKGIESNNRARILVESFVNDLPIEESLTRFEDAAKFTKKDIMKFAKENFNNYVFIHKKQGEDKNVVKVEKPEITPIDIDRNNESEYVKKIKTETPENIKPVFVDYEKEIRTEKISDGINFSYIKNTTNDIFSLNYILDIGKRHDKELAIAVDYLQYLGTSKYSPEELKKELFRLGLDFGVNTSDKRSYIYVSGLEESYEDGIKLLEHIISEAEANKDIYNEYVARLLKARDDAKQDQGTIQRLAYYYGRYGKYSPLTDVLSAEELKAIDPEVLTSKIKSLTDYIHNIFYYGTRDFDEALDIVKENHTIEKEFVEAPPEQFYPEKKQEGKDVYIVDYDKLQFSIAFVTIDQELDKELFPKINLYNEYYGSGLSSIVFQEIRESKGLAYSAFSYYVIPRFQEDSMFLVSFVGTQPDKMELAMDTMLGLLHEMPEAEKQFEGSKDAMLRKLETERIIHQDIYWSYLNNLDLGIDYDYRKDIYNEIQNIDIKDMKDFFENHIKDRDYSLVVIGKKDNMDFDKLSKYGEIHELSLEELFGY